MTQRPKFTSLMARASRRYKMKVNAVLAAHHLDLSSEMAAVLLELWNAEGKSLRELAEIFKKDKSGMTRIIKSLAKRELIYAREDKHDRRRKKIELTEKGDHICTTIDPLLNSLRQHTLEGIANEDLQKAEGVLFQILDNLEKQ